MYKVDDLPEVVVLKGINGPGERIAFEVAEAIMQVLHEFVQQRPLEFYHLANLHRRGYVRALERALKKYFPTATEAIPAIMAVFRAALVSDGVATRLESPYDIEASYRHTGLLYDQHLYQMTQRIASHILQTSIEFGNSEERCWMCDCREQSPRAKSTRSQGLFLCAHYYQFPNQLITPWGTWWFAGWTDYTRSQYLRRGEEKFLTVATADLVLEPASMQRDDAFYAIESAFGDTLPQARIVSEPEQVGESQSRYITTVWEHAAQWLDPARYF